MGKQENVALSVEAVKENILRFIKRKKTSAVNNFLK